MIKINKFQKSFSQRLICPGQRIFKPGFSLIEVLVALFVLSLGVSAVFLLMSKSLRSSMDARDQIIASQLAQEGIELVRNLKDTEKLDAADSVCDYTQEETDGSNRKCSDLIIDMNDENLSDESNQKLNIINDGYYAHDTGEETKFFRRVDLTIEGTFDPSDPTSSDRKITVTTYVTWNGSGFSDSLIADCNVGNKCLSIVAVLADY